ncbi:MAG TPA: DNA polymerase III subunit gamma/tau [Candidatus Saccharimonadales bacterium]
MGKALYRKYRSKRLDEVVGQSHVTDILARSLKAGRISHAYLLTGPRGVGKTSIARILAHEINQLPYDDDSTHLDIIEMDAASNNGVEDVRDLREKVQIAPVSASRKVYIIDEVHMLSKAAFNALLKTLEEPPEHAVFILATTDADKLPATIISRTQRFTLRYIAQADAIKHLRHIADSEKLKIENEALALIAARGDGTFRDSISLLDQLRGVADEKTGITRELVEQSLGLAPKEIVEKLLAAYEARDLKEIVGTLDEAFASGIQTSALVSQLTAEARTRIASQPVFIPLLDQLLEVAKSSQPDIKLLTVLAAHAAPKPKTVALAAPVAEVSAPVAELQKMATRPRPQMQKQTPVAAPKKPAASTPVEAPKPHIPSTPPTGEFDWDKLIEYARANYVAVYSVLSKCTHELDGDTLVLYTGNAFYKKKLDDSKHRINLSTALIETGAGDMQIETIGTPPPPKDSTAASVAAIMGGGEEVSVDMASA